MAATESKPPRQPKQSTAAAAGGGRDPIDPPQQRSSSASVATPETVIIDNSRLRNQKRKSEKTTTPPTTRREEPEEPPQSTRTITSESSSKFGGNNNNNHDNGPSFSPSSSSASYPGVLLKDTVGTLTVTADRLVFKPKNKADKAHIFAWPLNSLQKHQISAASDNCLLKLTSQQSPSKAVTMTFPNRQSLESVHSVLTNKLQPLRKYRKVKECLLTTQRKLKEANKTIDKLQDTNQELLGACEKFAKKTKQLTEQLKQQQQQQDQELAKRGVVSSTKVMELEVQLASFQNQCEKLENEKTAMHIEFEMDLTDERKKVRTLERDLIMERAALEKMLDDRQPMDALQLEVNVLARQLLVERQSKEELQDRLEQHQREAEESLWEVRRQRNNAFLELAHVKTQCDELQRQREQEQLQLEQQLQEAKQGQAQEAPLLEDGGAGLHAPFEEEKKDTTGDANHLMIGLSKQGAPQGHTTPKETQAILPPRTNTLLGAMDLGPHEDHSRIHDIMMLLVTQCVEPNRTILPKRLTSIQLWEREDALILKEMRIREFTNSPSLAQPVSVWKRDGPSGWALSKQVPLWKREADEAIGCVIEPALHVLSQQQSWMLRDRAREAGWLYHSLPDETPVGCNTCIDHTLLATLHEGHTGNGGVGGFPLFNWLWYPFVETVQGCQQSCKEDLATMPRFVIGTQLELHQPAISKSVPSRNDCFQLATVESVASYYAPRMSSIKRSCVDMGGLVAEWRAPARKS